MRAACRILLPLVMASCAAPTVSRPAGAARSPVSYVAPTDVVPPSRDPAPALDGTSSRLRVERTEETTSVTVCQVGPFSSASRTEVDAHVLAPQRLAMRVVEDDERATSVPAHPSLSGKGYTVDASLPLNVRDSRGEVVPEAEADRVRALATVYLAWPGRSALERELAPGAEAASFEGPLIAIAAIPLHGAAQRGDDGKALVRYRRRSDSEWVFDVHLTASRSDAGMCHRWTHVADTSGELHVAAADGALLELDLGGTTSDTEGLCQDPSGGPGLPRPPRTCNRGTVRVHVRQERATR